MTTKTWTKRPNKNKFEGPEDLWNCSVSYFEWVEANPIWKEVMTKNGPVQMMKPRAMTIQGFCLHVGITPSTYYSYKKIPEFADVIEAIECVMYEQKFTAAVAETMNPGIITRDLNLADKKEVSGPGGAPIEGGFTFIGVGPDSDE